MHDSWFFKNNLIHLIKSFLNQYFLRGDTKNKWLTESKAFSMSTASKIPSICNKSVIYAISEISLPSLINLLFKYAIWFSLIKLFKIFFSLIAITFKINLVAIFNKEIGRQFLINRLSLSFFPINLITACFWEVDSSPNIKDFFMEQDN